MDTRARKMNGQFRQRTEGEAEPDAGLEDETLCWDAPTPKNCRNFIRDRTAEALPKVMAKLIQRAKGGSIPHVALLLKTAGLDAKGDVVPKPEKKRGKGLAQVLKEQWAADAKKLEAAAKPNRMTTFGE